MLRGGLRLISRGTGSTFFAGINYAKYKTISPSVSASFALLSCQTGDLTQLPARIILILGLPYGAPAGSTCAGVAPGVL